MNKFIFLFCLLSFSGRSQDFRFNNYNINDGLSQSNVNTIVQDDFGGLWIGTQDGLNRFDGKSFEIFNADETDGIESPYIQSSVKTEDQKIWFGTRNGLTFYNPTTEKFQTFTIDKKKIFDIQDISISKTKEFFIATLGYGIVKFNPSNNIFTIIDWPDGAKKISLISCLDKGNLLVYTEDEKLYHYNPLTLESFQVPTSNLGYDDFSILKIRQTKKGKILLGTSHGVYQYNQKNKSVQRDFQSNKALQNLSIKDLIYSNNQWFFATSASGLYTLNEDGDLFNSTQDLFQKSALMYDKLSFLYKDLNGNVWIGSDRGVSSFDPDYSGFMGVGPGSNLKKSLPSQNVWSFCEDQSARYLYVGTDLGISRLDRNSGIFSHLNRWKTGSSGGSKQQFTVLSSYCISQDTLLVGFEDGLFKLIISSDSVYRYERVNYVEKKMLAEFNRVYRIKKDGKNAYFLSTKGGVIHYDLKTQKRQVFSHKRANPKGTITNGFCRVAYKDRKGDFWFATTEGLNILKKEDGKYSIVPHSMNAQILKASKNQITTICDDEKGNLYLGTFGSGILYLNLNSRTIDIINKKKGLPNNVLYGLIKKDDKLWMSTNRGIASYDIKTNEISSYKEVNGLVSNEFNTNAYLNSKTGYLYFGSIYGYNFFKPEDLSYKDANVEVIITKFKLNDGWLKPGDQGSPLNQVISQTKNLILSYDQRSFTIRFQTSDLLHPRLTNYKYELVGSGAGEQLLGEQNELTFNSLSPGDYTIKIYARIGDGPWSSIPTTLHVSIEPPYWLTWWFWTIAALLITIIAFVIFRRRLESERREQVKLEIKVMKRTKEIREQSKQIEDQSRLIEDEKDKVIKQQKLLQVEKDNAERWLSNALPEEVVRELKVNGKVEVNSFKVVSVMFTDVVGFTKISQKIKPGRLVHRLDVLFRKFDEVIQNNDLEKIKTIGDAYMCAGGIPIENSTNPMNACIAALQIQDYMSKLKFDAIANHKDYWEIRLGINTGPVTAGIIGDLKMAYDVWGSTVNEAQQMEKLGEPGQVTVTGSTFNYIEPYFECDFLGKVTTKGNVDVDMYSVKHIKNELSVRGKGIVPNKKFSEIVQLHHFSSIKYYKTEHFVLDHLKKGLSKKLLYHSVNHSIDVVQAVERIALLEGVTDEGLFLLKTAAILHDAGFVEQYENNESIGAQMASEWLPKYGYSDQHIKTIVELIHVTEIPHRPINKLQEIICDADLDYLGRDDFSEISDRLRRELRGMKKIDSDRKWDEIQIKFLKSHQYFTKTSINARRKKKMENLKGVISRLETNKYKD